MIWATRRTDGGVDLETETRGAAVYLDNFAIIELAKHEPSRRQRLVDAVRAKGTLLFSIGNALELTGPQGDSARAVRSFLGSIGPLWVPLGLNWMDLADGEQKGR